MSVVLVVLFLLAGYVVLAFVLNRFSSPAAVQHIDFASSPDAREAGKAVTVSTWNIGYAGMGAGADFIMDLGEQKRPTDAALVDRNLIAIRQEIGTLDADVSFFQEAAEPSFSTHGRNVVKGLRKALPDYDWMYVPEIETKLIPPPLKSSVGNAIFTRLAAKGAEVRALPLEPTFEYGAFRKSYKMHVLRLSGPEKWVMVNIHLSTFDTAEDDVRAAQVEALLKFAQAEYASGSRVVIGGDWNLRLAPTTFPHKTDEKFQFWIRDFPAEKLPPDWQWAVDPEVPTVRTAHKPYVEGENYVLIIDGFLVSPNVQVDSVGARNLGFEYTDHHPVVARFSAR